MGKTKETIIILIIGLIYSVFAAYFQWETFSIRYNLDEYEYMYSNSQYVLGDKSKNTIGDGDIYVYAGVNYLDGSDPTSINFEHPPLAKLLYGLSYRFFGYPNLILIPLFMAMLVSFWYLTGSVFTKYGYRYLSIFLLLTHSTVYKEIARTMLDFPQTAFLLITTAIFSRLINKPTYLNIILFGISSGLLLSIKYPLPLIVIYLFLLLVSAMINKLPILKIITVIFLAFITYLSFYIGFFLNNHSVIDYLKFEWWRWKWYQGKVDNPQFLIYEVIFLGRYKKWWDKSGDYVYFPHWNLLWPVTFMGYILSWLTKRLDYKHPLFPYKVWVLLSMVVLSLGAYEDRFLMPLIPGFIIFGVKWAAETVKKWDNT